MKALYIYPKETDINVISNLFRSYYANKIELITIEGVENGRKALFNIVDLKFLVLDVAFKEDDPNKFGLETLESVGEIPFIFYGESRLLKSRVSFDSYNKFEHIYILERPTNGEVFCEMVDRIISFIKQEDFEQSIIKANVKDFVPLKIRQFYFSQVLNYDVYLELTSTKFVRIIQKKVKYHSALIQKYALKGVKYLYLKKEDQVRFLEENMTRFSKILSSNIPLEKIIAIETVCYQLIREYITEIGVTDKILKFVSLFLKSMTKHFEARQKKLVKILDHFFLDSIEIADRGVLLFYTCSSILKNMGWESVTIRDKMGLASLLYDVYLDEDLCEIYETNGDEWGKLGKEEQDIFIEHARKASQLASQFTHIPEAEFIILDHHELPDGKGFPRKLTATSMGALSCVFVLALHFVRYYVRLGPKKLKMIIHKLESDFGRGNFRDAVTGLKKEFLG